MNDVHPSIRPYRLWVEGESQGKLAGELENTILSWQDENSLIYVISTNDSKVDNVMFSREGLTEAERKRK